MSDKYIIRNCPAISFTIGCLNEEVEVWDCRDCTDCVMKQIVELCNLNYTKYTNLIAKEILKRLDIQEVE